MTKYAPLLALVFSACVEQAAPCTDGVNLTYPVGSLEFPFVADFTVDGDGSIRPFSSIECNSSLDCTHGVLYAEISPVPELVQVRITKLGLEIVDTVIAPQRRQVVDDSVTPPRACVIGEAFLDSGLFEEQ